MVVVSEIKSNVSRSLGNISLLGLEVVAQPESDVSRITVFELFCFDRNSSSIVR